MRLSSLSSRQCGRGEDHCVSILYRGMFCSFQQYTHERLRGITYFLFFKADVPPLAVPHDTTPLHTPTLLPMSPQPAPAAAAAPPAAAAQASHPPESEPISQHSESHITLSAQKCLNCMKTNCIIQKIAF